MPKAAIAQKQKARCPACDAGLWLRDNITGMCSGPWHFIDCPEVPGGKELADRNLLAQIQYAQEKVIPRKQGQRILRAIYTMLSAPNQEVMEQRKAAIHQELKNLEEQ